MVLFSPQADIEQKTQLESKRLVNSSTTPFFPNKKTCNPSVGIRQRPQELASSRHSRIYTRRTGQSTGQLFQRTPRSAIRRAGGSYRLRRPSERVYEGAESADVSLASFQNVRAIINVRCHIVPRLPALSDWRRRGVKKVVWCRVAKLELAKGIGSEAEFSPPCREKVIPRRGRRWRPLPSVTLTSAPRCRCRTVTSGS